MKKIFLYLLFPLMISTSCKQVKKQNEAPTSDATVTQQTPTPTSIYVDLEGNPISLSDYQGKKILLNFWATWCRPCIAEMPSLLRAKEILEKENYQFLLVSDQSVKKITDFKERVDYDFNFIRTTAALSQLNIYALPTTFIYNEKGEKVEEITGAVEWDAETMITKLKNIQ
ncbi:MULTISPECIES: TlpA family protein disulfide reductase [Arenibacter]|uniref:TlpA family protein disulfide reductase n=1 Tax=Arenibacter TaxID=178469 RepID=UPI001CC4EA6F|nr:MULTISPECIES: TlpA disulfide reductase family protein [Arenibacter]